MKVIYQFILSFLATIGFAAYFNAPKKSILPTGFIGGISWSLFYFLNTYYQQKIIGAFLAALLIGILGEVFAIIYKKPATVFITPGIVPLVPGAGMYYTMLYLVEEKIDLAVSKGVETFFLAAAISAGIIGATVLVRIIRSIIKTFVRKTSSA